MIEFRRRNSGHYQIPVTYVWYDELAVGALGPEVELEPEPAPSQRPAAAGRSLITRQPSHAYASLDDAAPQDRQPDRRAAAAGRADRRDRAAVEPGDRAARARAADRLLRDHLPRGHARLPPDVHPSRLRVLARVPGGDRGARLDGGRGLGDHLGGRPPQAPRVHRPGGRPALAPPGRPGLLGRRSRACGTPTSAGCSRPSGPPTASASPPT